MGGGFLYTLQKLSLKFEAKRLVWRIGPLSFLFIPFSTGKCQLVLTCLTEKLSMSIFSTQGIKAVMATILNEISHNMDSMQYSGASFDLTL